MCDYSLALVASRPAKVGDKLICTNFTGTNTLGFAALEDVSTAVCLLPGTELAFAKGVRYRYGFLWILRRWTSSRVARFCQVNMEKTLTHHDALQLIDGRVVTLQQLVPGQRATVLQMPAQPRRAGSDREAPSRTLAAPSVAQTRLPA